MSRFLIRRHRIPSRHRRTHRMLAWLAVRVARLSVRLPKRVLLAFLPLVRFAARLLGGRDGSQSLALDDLEGIIRTDPRGWEALRRMVLKSRTGQFKAFVHGVLAHHIESGATMFLASGPLVRRTPRVKGPGEPLSIAILGRSHDLEQLRRAYARMAEVRIVDLGESGEGRIADLDGKPTGSGAFDESRLADLDGKPTGSGAFDESRLADLDGKLIGLGSGGGNSVTDFDTMLATLDGIEIGGNQPPDEALIAAALERGISVSLHASCLESPELLERLNRLADDTCNPIRFYHPALYYPPVHRVKSLLLAGEIGEICAVRIRATVGCRDDGLTQGDDGRFVATTGGDMVAADGLGARGVQNDDRDPGEQGDGNAGAGIHIGADVGTDRPMGVHGMAGDGSAFDLPSGTRYLGHPAFDQFLLLEYWGGVVEKVVAYLNPMVPGEGGQGLVGCKYADPGRYGLLELSHAPYFVLATTELPWDLDVEIAGSDGIIWLRNAMARHTQAAPILVRVGRKAYTIGTESGLDDRWAHVYRHAAEHFVEGLHGRFAPLVDPSAVVSSLKLRMAAYQAVEWPGVLTLA